MPSWISCESTCHWIHLSCLSTTAATITISICSQASSYGCSYSRYFGLRSLG
jgi:hypothetical protein